ncbi:MAG TPA: MarR family transcriptional regulator [Marinagarivorans sp.]
MPKAISDGDVAHDGLQDAQPIDSVTDTEALFEVSEVVRQLLVRVRRNLARSVSKHHINLSVQAVHILILIHRPDMNSPMKLACHSGYDKAVITRIVKQLLQDELVDKLPDEQDKRSVRLSLTAKGQALYQQLNTVRLEAHQAIFAPLNNAELQQVKSLLQKCL